MRDGTNGDLTINSVPEPYATVSLVEGYPQDVVEEYVEQCGSKNATLPDATVYVKRIEDLVPVCRSRIRRCSLPDIPTCWRTPHSAGLFTVS